MGLIAYRRIALPGAHREGDLGVKTPTRTYSEQLTFIESFETMLVVVAIITPCHEITDTNAVTVTNTTFSVGKYR